MPQFLGMLLTWMMFISLLIYLSSCTFTITTTVTKTLTGDNCTLDDDIDNKETTKTDANLEAEVPLKGL